MWLRKWLGAVHVAEMAFYADAELGGGAALVRDTVAGDRCVPGGFVGVRLGYGMPMTSTFEAEFVFHAIALPEDNSFMFGVGLAWE